MRITTTDAATDLITGDPIWIPEPELKMPILVEIFPREIARRKFWVYILNALATGADAHCRVKFSPGCTPESTWLYVLEIDRPYLVGSTETVLLYEHRALEPGALVRFKCEHIAQVMITTG